MIEYPKIDTLFKRNEKHVIMPWDFHRDVYGTISEWVVTEKIDGTNIRVDLRWDAEKGKDVVAIGGRTGGATLAPDLLMKLVNLLPVDSLAALRQDPNEKVSITLFGEGYGAGIQKGGGYRGDKSFILFDVLINDKWWLKDEAVTGIAGKLGIERVPVIGQYGLAEIVEMVRKGFKSMVPGSTCMAEGVVARPIEPLFDTMHRRLILKLKTKDFTGGR